MRTDLEIALMQRFPDFRKIWVQKTKLNSICITLFTNNNYNMLFNYKLPSQINYELCEKMIAQYLNTES